MSDDPAVVSSNEEQADNDPRISSAKRWLQSALEEAFITTAQDCAYETNKYFDRVPIGTPDELVGPFNGYECALHEWRKKSLSSIAEGFRKIFEATNNSGAFTSKSPADRASDIAWQIVNESFHWTAAGTNGADRFSEWDHFAGTESNGHDQDARDFRAQFSNVLLKLREEGSLQAPRQENATDEYPVGCKSKDRTGIHRARQVQNVIKELKKVKYEMEQLAQQRPRPGESRVFDQLAQRYSNYIVFRMSAESPRVRSTLLEGIGKQRWVSLAQEIVAHLEGRAVSTIQKAWKLYHKDVDLGRHSNANVP